MKDNATSEKELVKMSAHTYIIATSSLTADYLVISDCC